MIEHWNAKVPEDGTVFHLGDLGFGDIEALKNIVEQLNGTIYIIRGNHDPYLNNCPYLDFKNIRAVYPQLKIRIEGTMIYLNHFPFLCFDHSYNGLEATWQLFGHVHSGPNSGSGLDCRRLVNLFPTQYDVGADNNEFVPVSFDEVKAKISDQMNSQMLLNYNQTNSGLGWFSVKKHKLPEGQQVVLRCQFPKSVKYETILVKNSTLDYDWLEEADVYWYLLPKF